MLTSGLQTSWAYSTGGPIGNAGDAWQQPVIGYGLGGDLNAPKNLGEEYRRNTPVMYYAFDATFLDDGSFGPRGALSVDAAFAILNSLTNVDIYSKQLTEFSLETRNINYQAQALGLFDLKSETLGLMMEQLGLADPVRYAWTLHDRLHVGPVPCPVGMEYLVVQRNYDYVSSPSTQLQYSPYVNDTLYSYQILEGCTGTPTALAVPFSVDPLADIYSPVASFISGSIFWGDYYTGLTRDDMAGLRYLLSTNNINWETPAADALLIVTNTSFPILFPVVNGTNGESGLVIGGIAYGTSSYGNLLTFAKTNNLAAVQAAYPGLQATLVSSFNAIVTVTNIISYFTNYVGEAIGSPPHLITRKIPTQTFVTYYNYTFDNIITNIYSATTTSKIKTITVAPLNGAPVGSPLATNVTTKTVKSNVPSGEFFILPPQSPCGLDIINSLTFTNYTTNVITSATATNGTTGTNSGNSYSQIMVTPNISHVYNINPVTCSTADAITGLYRGIGKIKFIRADFDSLLGQTWRPVTNDYSMVLITTNSKPSTQFFRRIVTQPDFLFTAQDLDTSPSDPVIGAAIGARSLSFNQINAGNGLAGPGIINTPQFFTYNKAGPSYFNSSEDVMDGTPYFTQTPGGDITDLYYITYFVWASFDGSTNAPVVFPNGTSIDDLENQILIKVSPANPLPVGTVDVDYYVLNSVQFTASGGAFSPPFTWSASGLPDGLSVQSDGKLVGVPTQSGTFDFNLQLQDSLGRSVQWTYTITITP